MAYNLLNQSVNRFSQRMKTSWQVLFILTILIYSISLYHSLRINPSIMPNALKYAQNLDLLSFVIAIILAVVIFNLKRKYFSKKFSRIVTESSLRSSPNLSDEELLTTVFRYLKKKMLLIWILAVLIVLDGVIFYWLIYLSRNMHIYFVVGIFSLILNYPRKELFVEIPWYVRESRENFSSKNLQ